jgi:hypothetical protein
MFEDGRWVAKIADFSHSCLIAGGARHLPGGTLGYGAPEWKKRLPAAGLAKTDVYSFGILFASVMAGYDIIQAYCENVLHGRTPRERFANLQARKENNTFTEHVMGLLYNIGDTNLVDGTERPRSISTCQRVLECALHPNPEQRKLGKIESLLRANIHISKMSRLPAHGHKAVQKMGAELLAIPYQSLDNMSDILKGQVLRSLEHVAQDEQDERCAEASYELCVCLLSGFGTETDHAAAARWLVRAAQKNEPWAKSVARHLLDAVGHDNAVSPSVLENWLLEAASAGSWMALQSLHDMSSPHHEQAFRMHRALLNSPRDETGAILEDKTGLAEADDPGECPLHFSAISGNIDDFSTENLRSLAGSGDMGGMINRANINGDSPLMCACRAGRADVILRLIELKADVNTVNKQGENCLHLLPCLHRDVWETIATKLVQAGADWTHQSHGSSMIGRFDIRVTVAGCPMVRAVTLNKPGLLDVLLRLESRFQKPLDTRASRVQLSNIKRMIALACRCNYSEILETLARHRPDAFDSTALNTMWFWSEGRQYTLAALAIKGCVSDRPELGIDVPEKFWRFLNNGRNCDQELIRTLAFLENRGVDFQNTRCGGFANGLFFAIQTGSTDAVAHFLSAPTSANDFAPFGTRHLRESIYWPAALPWNSALPNHRYKMGLVRAVQASISCSRLEIFKLLLRWNDHEALRWGGAIPIIEAEAWRIYRLFRRPSEHGQAPGDHDMGRCFPVFVYAFYTVPSEKDACRFLSQPCVTGRLRAEFAYVEEIDASDLFTVAHGARVRCIFKSDDTRIAVKHRKLSDGRLNYGLLYMLSIALAAHRDIEFA